MSRDCALGLALPFPSCKHRWHLLTLLVSHYTCIPQGSLALNRFHHLVQSAIRLERCHDLGLASRRELNRVCWARHGRSRQQYAHLVSALSYGKSLRI